MFSNLIRSGTKMTDLEQAERAQFDAEGYLVARNLGPCGQPVVGGTFALRVNGNKP